MSFVAHMHRGVICGYAILGVVSRNSMKVIKNIGRKVLFIVVQYIWNV